MQKKYFKRCECNGGLGGDGWATEKWKGDLVCKECVKRDKKIAYMLSDNRDILDNQKCFARRERKQQYVYE